jgi:hypothetical protein
VITDWKTSSIYKDKKLEKESGQLLIYAINFMEKGIPLENIKVRWNFLKYINVEVNQANGKTVQRTIERNSLGNSLKRNASMWLKKSEYSEDEIEDYCSKLIETNSIECLPKDIQLKYNIEDCYVYVDLNHQIIKDFKVYVCDVLGDANKKKLEYEKNEDEMIWWQDVTDDYSYFLSNLCGYSAKKHKPYSEYLDKFNNKNKGEYDWMKELF